MIVGCMYNSCPSGTILESATDGSRELISCDALACGGNSVPFASVFKATASSPNCGSRFAFRGSSSVKSVQLASQQDCFLPFSGDIVEFSA